MDNSASRKPRVFYLVGPSGIGKSTLASFAQNSLAYVRHHDVDALVSQHLSGSVSADWSVYWGTTQAVLYRLEEQPTNALHLADIGAGSLQMREALQFFRERRNQLVLLDDDVRSVFIRVRNRPGGFWVGRNVEEFVNAEFSVDRQAVYGLAPPSQVLDVRGLDQSSAQALMLRLCQRLWECR